jgi:hypothetical protein
VTCKSNVHYSLKKKIGPTARKASTAPCAMKYHDEAVFLDKELVSSVWCSFRSWGSSGGIESSVKVTSVNVLSAPSALSAVGNGSYEICVALVGVIVMAY